MVRQPITESAAVLDLDSEFDSTDADVARRFHPLYGDALSGAPRGHMTTRGLPFRLADEDSERRWLAIERSTSVDLGGVAATHLVLMLFCDAWRDWARSARNW